MKFSRLYKLSITNDIEIEVSNKSTNKFTLPANIINTFV